MKGLWFADPLRWLVGALIITGIVMAALDKAYAGFTPAMWILLAIVMVLIVICAEALSIRLWLTGKEKEAKQ